MNVLFIFVKYEREALKEIASGYQVGDMETDVNNSAGSQICACCIHALCVLELVCGLVNSADAKLRVQKIGSDPNQPLSGDRI